MTKFIKIIRRTLLIFLIAIPICAFAHFVLFPQQTRSILIDYSDLQKDGRLYFNYSAQHYKIDTIKLLIELASNRVAGFWGQKTCNPTFIYCESEDDFKKYGSPYQVPALTHVKLGSYIVISHDGIDLDIIAHEISHAEFYERIGFYNWSFKIPAWFDEGLAMQNDYRDYYSEDTLRVKSNNYKDLPDVKNLTSGKQFNGEGTREQIKLNFMTAKHEVKNWYTKEKLDQLIKDINSGKSFDEVFGK
ncbi:MAG: hypothetical protein IPL55_12275 [Saprospiraceae bacterium]|nr:hypothetical protein [Saprospiraceae bacterium]